MKVRLNISISEEARDALGNSPSRKVEELALAPAVGEVPWLDLEARIDELKGLLNAPGNAPGNAPACCKRKEPCRHWSYDGERWKNYLTGESKEVL